MRSAAAWSHSTGREGRKTRHGRNCRSCCSPGSARSRRAPARCGCRDQGPHRVGQGRAAVHPLAHRRASGLRDGAPVVGEAVRPGAARRRRRRSAQWFRSCPRPDAFAARTARTISAIPSSPSPMKNASMKSAIGKGLDTASPPAITIGAPRRGPRGAAGRRPGRVSAARWCRAARGTG